MAAEERLRELFVSGQTELFRAECLRRTAAGERLPAGVARLRRLARPRPPQLTQPPRVREKYFADFALRTGLIFDAQQRVNIALYVLNTMHQHLSGEKGYGVLHAELIDSLRLSANPTVQIYHDLLTRLRTVLLGGTDVAGELTRCGELVQRVHYYDADVFSFALYVVQEAAGRLELAEALRGLLGSVRRVLVEERPRDSPQWTLLSLVLLCLEGAAGPAAEKARLLKGMEENRPDCLEALSAAECLPFNCVAAFLAAASVSDPLWLELRWRAEEAAGRARGWAAGWGTKTRQRHSLKNALALFAQEFPLRAPQGTCAETGSFLLLAALARQPRKALGRTADLVASRLRDAGAVWEAALASQTGSEAPEPPQQPLPRALAGFLVDQQLIVRALRAGQPWPTEQELLRRLGGPAARKHSSGATESLLALAAQLGLHLCLLCAEPPKP